MRGLLELMPDFAVSRASLLSIVLSFNVHRNSNAMMGVASVEHRAMTSQNEPPDEGIFDRRIVLGAAGASMLPGQPALSRMRNSRTAHGRRTTVAIRSKAQLRTGNPSIAPR
jgi:hypothetical protein